MKSIFFCAIFGIIFATNVTSALDQTSKSKQEPNEAQLAEHKHYTNKSGNTVHSPAHSKSREVPDGATAKCRDGTYSFSQSHRGTCSKHGGVGQWL